MEDISNLAKEIEGVINEREKIINYNNDSILETINISELKKLIILKYCEFDKNSTIRKCSLLIKKYIQR